MNPDVTAEDELMTYRVNTPGSRRAVAGSDSSILTLPADLYGMVSGNRPALNLGRLGRLLREVSHAQAAALGETLHHADWVITSDPKIVEQRGMHDPACTDCRTGVDLALVKLMEHPEAELLVGMLYWAGPE